jgi:Phosphate-selective porin O and P
MRPIHWVPVTLSSLVIATSSARAQEVPPQPLPVESPAVPAPVPPPTAAVQPDVEEVGQPAAQSDQDQKETKGKRSKKKKIVVSGFLTAMYKFRVDHNGDGKVEPDAFRLGKAVVRVDGKINRHFGYQLEIDPRSPTIAGVLRDGYIRVRRLVPHHEIRIGQQKTPWGYENWQSSTKLYFTSRTELSEGLGRGLTHRDIGIGIVGKVKLNEQWRLEDAVALVNGDGFGVQADSTHLKNVWGRMGTRYKGHDLVIHTGLSGAIGDQIEPNVPGEPVNPRTGFRRLGIDFEVDHKWGFLGAEYATGWEEIPAESGVRERQSAYFVTVAGKTPWHLGPVLRYDAADAGGFWRVTAGMYWGEPDARVRLFSDYEYFEDDLGKHDARVETQLQVVF